VRILAGGPGRGRPDTTSVRVEYLDSVDGFVVFDMLHADASGGGTRLAPDITEAETRLLARAMTYKLAVLGIPVGGAKIGLRAMPADRDCVLSRFREEISGRLAGGELMTGPDLGTTEDDFLGLPLPGGDDGVASTRIGGLPAEEALTGIGVASAIDAALDSGLDGRDVALEGFGKMGASIARAIAPRGGRIVAVSTVAGCAVADSGRCFSVADLLEARDEWGDDLVAHLGVPMRPCHALWGVECHALVPGARPGAVDERTARIVSADVVVPVANAPYTVGGLAMLAARSIPAHADFVASAGGAMAYLAPDVAKAGDAYAARESVDRIMGAIIAEAREYRSGPYAGAVAIAERFIRGWAPESDWPDRPPLA
jgi:glutamate dehydrogenase (NAD(P)+)